MSRPIFSFSKLFYYYYRIFSSIDRWDYYKMYIQTVAVLVTDKMEAEKLEEDQTVDNTFEKCHEFLNEVICQRFITIIKHRFLTNFF